MYEVSFVTNKAGKKGWSGIYGYRPDKLVELEQKGEMLILLSLSSDIDFDYKNLGQLLFDELQQSYYFASQFTSPLEQLELAVNMMNKRITKILEREPELSESGIDLNCAISIVKQDVAYLSVIGEARVVLARETQLVNVDEHLQDPTGLAFLRVGSVQLQPARDALALMSPKASDMLSGETVGELMQQLDLGSVKHIDDPLFSVAVVAHEDRIAVVQEQGAGAKSQESEETGIRNQESGAGNPEPGVSSEEPGVEGAETGIGDQGTAPIARPGAVVAAQSPEIKDEMNDALSEVSASTEPPAEDLQLPVATKSESSAPDKHNVESEDNSRLAAYAQQAKQLGSKALVGGKGVYSRVRAWPVWASLAYRLRDLRDRLISAEDGEGKTYQVLLAKVWKAVKNVRTVIVRFFRRNFLGKADGTGRARYMQGRGGRNWRLIGIVGIVLFVLLAVVVSNAVDNANQQAARETALEDIVDYEQQVLSLEAEVDRTVVLPDNAEDRYQKVQSRESLIDQFKDIDVSEIRESDDLESRISEQIDLLESQIDNLRGVVIADPELIADLGINFQDVNPTDMVYHAGSLYVSDSGSSAIYKVSAEPGATPTLLTSDKLISPQALLIDDNGDLIVYDEDADGSLSTVNLVDGSVQKHYGGINPSNGGIADDLASFRLGSEDRVYWIDTVTSELKWARRSPVGGYGSAPNVRFGDPELSEAVDIAVDGRIFALNPNVGVLRYFGTESDPYTLAGLMPDDALTGMSAFVLGSSNIYLADPEDQRIVVLSKARNGTDASFIDFISQHVYRGQDNVLSDIIEIDLDEAEENIYILDGLKLYRMQAYEN